jgi:hypothetical protein
VIDRARPPPIRVIRLDEHEGCFNASESRFGRAGTRWGRPAARCWDCSPSPRPPARTRVARLGALGSERVPLVMRCRDNRRGDHRSAPLSMKQRYPDGDQAGDQCGYRSRIWDVRAPLRDRRRSGDPCRLLRRMHHRRQRRQHHPSEPRRNRNRNRNATTNSFIVVRRDERPPTFAETWRSPSLYGMRAYRGYRVYIPTPPAPSQA